MKYNIDPTVDCVFKRLFGTEENKDLLLHFLNSVLDPPKENRIITVTLLNPYNEKEFLSDKLSIVDLKAKDARGKIYHIDIQICILQALKQRMLYSWSDLYSAQLQEGQDYIDLKPVVSIWILCDTAFREPEAKGFHHHFYAHDPVKELVLIDHFSIHVLELTKFDKITAGNELERWIMFFKKGKHLDDENLPDFMNTEEMRKAMEILSVFSQKEKEYHLYQSRMNNIRLQRTVQRSFDELKQALALAEQEKERSDQEKEQIFQEKEQIFQQMIREKEQAAEREKMLLQKIKELETSSS